MKNKNRPKTLQNGRKVRGHLFFLELSWNHLRSKVVRKINQKNKNNHEGSFVQTRYTWSILSKIIQLWPDLYRNYIPLPPQSVEVSHFVTHPVSSNSSHENHTNNKKKRTKQKLSTENAIWGTQLIQNLCGTALLNLDAATMVNSFEACWTPLKMCSAFKIRQNENCVSMGTLTASAMFPWAACLKTPSPKPD